MSTCAGGSPTTTPSRSTATASTTSSTSFSNFTFFLNDPVNGDQIEQSDRNRIVAGLDTDVRAPRHPLRRSLVSTAGFQFRLDRPRVVLSHTADRHLLERTQDVNIFETSYSPFVKFDFTPLPWLRFITGARGDIFNFNVRNNLTGVPDQPNGSATQAHPERQGQPDPRALVRDGVLRQSRDGLSQQ